MSDISNTGLLLGWRKAQRSLRLFGESRIEPEQNPTDTTNVIPFPAAIAGETRA